jgi:hypothetical protein
MKWDFIFFGFVGSALPSRQDIVMHLETGQKFGIPLPTICQ